MESLQANHRRCNLVIQSICGCQISCPLCKAGEAASAEHMHAKHLYDDQVIGRSGERLTEQGCLKALLALSVEPLNHCQL